MNYRKIYDDLMLVAKSRIKIEGYFEKHHINPKSLFPELARNKQNIVKLTAREHFVAHLLLAKIYGGPLFFAAQSMSLNGRYGSRSYEWLRIESARYLSETRIGPGNPMFGRTPKRESVDKRIASMRANRGDNPGPLKGRRYSDDEKAERKRKLVGKPVPFKGKKHTAESLEKMSKAQRARDPSSRRRGFTLSEERKQIIREFQTGRNHLDETKQKISNNLKGRKKPPRSEAHKKNLAEANRRKAVILKENNARDPKPSKSMKKILFFLSEKNDLQCSELSRLTSFNMATIQESMIKMVDRDWVGFKIVESKRVIFGRSSFKIYYLTQKGLDILTSTGNPC